MGIRTEFTDEDPYRTAAEMMRDVRDHRRLRVLSARATGGHPFFSNEENEQFRAVHDFFGHAATGREFDAHGEEAAALAHAKMFSHHALPALISETRGQNGSLNLNGEFPPQKVALLPPHLWTPRGPGAHMAKVATKQQQRLHKVAHDSGDGETIYHCPFCGSGQVIARSDRSIECEFCHTCFTVQVQPQFPAFPQTIDGAPVQIPGMPGQINAGDPGGLPPVDPSQMDENGEVPPGQDDGSGFPPGQGGDDQDDSDDDSDDEEDDDNAPPWAKKSFRTTAGRRLSGDDYVRHLAIRYAGDRPAMAARIKEERKA